MKNILLTTVLSFMITLTFAQTPQFRNLDWGTNIQTVKQKEEARFVVQKDNHLEYMSTLGNYHAGLEYSFTINGKLMGAKYIIDNHFGHTQNYFDEYNFFSKLLTEKYGKAAKSTIFTSQENAKKENLHLMLLKDGKYSQETQWETSDMAIKLMLYGTTDNGILTIHYVSKKYKDVNHKAKKEKIIKDL